MEKTPEAKFNYDILIHFITNRPVQLEPDLDYFVPGESLEPFLSIEIFP